MDFTTIQIGIEKNVARIALNRPEVRNAMNAQMIRELTEAVKWLDSRDDIVVIEICGNGKCFCAGADLNYMKEMANVGYEENAADARRLANLFKTVYFCNKAVISLVHGACVGGGNGITAASDIVLAEKETKFAFPEVKIGLTPATISPFVIAKCGETAAHDLMLSGRRFSAQEAFDFKLVNFVGTMDEINERLCFYIKEFLEVKPMALRNCKMLLRTVAHRDDPNDPIFEKTAQAIAIQRTAMSSEQ